MERMTALVSLKGGLLLLAAIIAAYALYASARFYLTLQISETLVNAAMPYERAGSDAVPMLVLGDSTAVGVGADAPADSVAGRTASYLSATSVENYAVSGAVTADLMGQLARAKLSHYRLILIQIGGNDIIRFHGAEETSRTLSSALEKLPNADKVVVISAGDVGGATLFPFFLRPFYTRLNLAYHAAFAETAREHGAIYVNLYDDPGRVKINDDPGTYLAADGLHPSSAGYELWFDAIRPAV